MSDKAAACSDGTSAPMGLAFASGGFVSVAVEVAESLAFFSRGGAFAVNGREGGDAFADNGRKKSESGAAD